MFIPCNFIPGTLGLTAIFMMKRGKLNYRYRGNSYTAHMLYALVKRKITATSGQRFLTFTLTVELNLAKPGKAERWVPIKLLFSRPRRESHDRWVVLLYTDTTMRNVSNT